MLPMSPVVSASDASRLQVIFGFLDEKIRSLEMLHGVPHGDNAVFSPHLTVEIIALLDIQSKPAAAVGHRVPRNVDSRDRFRKMPRFVEKKAVSAANLENVALAKIRNDMLQGAQPAIEIQPQTLFFGDIVQILVAMKIAPVIEIGYFLIRESQIGGNETASVALDQTLHAARLHAAATDETTRDGDSRSCRDGRYRRGAGAVVCHNR